MVKLKQSFLKSKKTVIIGSNYIAMELAAAMKQLNSKAEITIVSSECLPLETDFGKEVGEVIMK